MDIRLRDPLNEAEFNLVKGCKKAIDSEDVFEKIIFLKRSETGPDEAIRETLNTYYNYSGLRPKEFFSLDEGRALKLVNEMLEAQEMFPMDLQDAIEIMESDSDFEQMIKGYIESRISKQINEYLAGIIEKTVDKKAFSYEDHSIDYEEYRRRMEVLSKHLGDYFYQEERKEQ